MTQLSPKLTTGPKLTIGMAVYDDFSGVYMTVQALAMFHILAMRDVELIVVDNNPSSAQGRRTKGFIENWANVSKRFGYGARYIALPGVNSTSRPRQMIFDQAHADIVLVCDPHVLFPRVQDIQGLETSPFSMLLTWFDKNPSFNGILHGPMVYDDFQGFASHMADVFRGEMQGIWASDQRGDPNRIVDLLTCEPFEIPAHGMGMWVCRKSAWKQVGGFHSLQRGFGGEEFTIHIKFRQHGEATGSDTRTLCAPFLPWMHRFNDGSSIAYPLSRLDKLRNYIILYRDLKLPLDRLHKHFVEGLNEDGTILPIVVSEQQWQALLENPEPYPIKPVENAVMKNPLAVVRSEQEPPQAQAPKSIQSKIPPTLLMSIRSYLPNIKTFGILAFPDFPSNRVTLDYHEHLNQLPTLEFLKENNNGGLMDNIVIHNSQTAVELTAALERAAEISRRYITISNMGQIGYGEEGKPRIDALGNKIGNPGVLPGIRRFCLLNPEWTVVMYDPSGIGVMLLSKAAEDKPSLPNTLTMAWNYANAVKNHALQVLKGGDSVSEEEYKRRLNVCAICPNRADNRCTACGCPIEDKASWQSSFCPVGKWDDPHYKGADSLEVRIVNSVPTTQAPPTPPCVPCGG